MTKEKQSTPIRELTNAVTEHMKTEGYRTSTLKNYSHIYHAIVKFSENNHEGMYTEEIGEKFLQQISRKTSPLSTAYFRTYCTEIQRINHFLTGDRNWRPRYRASKEYISSCYDQIINEYEVYLGSTGKTRNDVRHRLHILSCFLMLVESSDIDDLQKLTTPCIYEGFRKATDKDGFRKSVRSFLKYAHQKSLTIEDFSVLVPSLKRHAPVPSVYTPEEVELMLASINQNKQSGKRNYAIALIAARLGLRSCDLVNLKFDNIHFEKNTIEIIQIKTGEPLILPLLSDVRNALIDYIENERPSYESNYIFLSLPLSRLGPMKPNRINKIISKPFQKAKIDPKGRRNGPHSLRASLATTLLNEGNDYSVIQKILGHTDPEAAKSYVKVDVENLRAYALAVPEPSAEFANKLKAGVIA